MSDNTKTRPKRTWTKKDLKEAYQITHETLLVWLCRIPGFMDIETLKRTRRFTPAQSDQIFNHLGSPE